MSIQPLPHDLQALERFEREGPFVWLWEPAGLSCVLGAGTPERDVEVARCAADGVPVFRRKGGGGAVLLGEGNLIITACYDAAQRRFPTQWIQPIAEAVARAIGRAGLPGAAVRGLGDVAVADRKVLGSSIYSNRRVILYQGSLLVDPDLSLIPLYLPHPSKEPDYRRGRSHLEFITSLRREGYEGGMEALAQALVQELGTV